MAISILPKFLTLKWNISRTISRIEVGNGSFFSIFHALSFDLNFFSTGGPGRRCPLMQLEGHTNPVGCLNPIQQSHVENQISTLSELSSKLNLQALLAVSMLVILHLIPSGRNGRNGALSPKLPETI